MEPLAIALFIFLYVTSIYTDIKWHKIKNFVTLPVAGVALILVTWNFGLRASFFYVLAAVSLSLLTEIFRIWGPGDSKLFISASLVSALWLQTADPRLVFYFLGINVLIYLVAGHAYTFYKSGCRPALYITNLKFGGEIGKMPGALPIAISNIAAVALYRAVT